MGFSQEYFITIILVSMCSKTFIKAPSEIDFTECLAHMQEYCGTVTLHIGDCAKRAIVHWEPGILAPHIREYHLKFRNKLIPGLQMLTPENFCAVKAYRCLYDLNGFIQAALNQQQTRISDQQVNDPNVRILEYAFFETTFADFESGNFGVDYLDHIANNSFVNEQTMINPQYHCYEMFILGNTENFAPDEQLITNRGKRRIRGSVLGRRASY